MCRPPPPPASTALPSAGFGGVSASAASGRQNRELTGAQGTSLTSTPPLAFPKAYSTFGPMPSETHSHALYSLFVLMRHYELPLVLLQTWSSVNHDLRLQNKLPV